MGSHPEGFVNEDEVQDFADELDIAFVGVSGTLPRGKNSFVWAENPEQDYERVRDALKEVSDRVTVKSGAVITLGFSQGAQVGLEIAVRHSDEFAGSIVLSPGADRHLDRVQPSPLLAKRGFVVAYGAKEHAGNVMLGVQDDRWLRQAKAKVIHRPYPGMAEHSLPPDFADRFPEWVRFIQKTAAGK
jgi:predicted esterase